MSVSSLRVPCCGLSLPPSLHPPPPSLPLSPSLSVYICQSDDVIWQVVNYQFCSFKSKIAEEQTFCRYSNRVVSEYTGQNRASTYISYDTLYTLFVFPCSCTHGNTV